MTTVVLYFALVIINVAGIAFVHLTLTEVYDRWSKKRENLNKEVN